MPQEVRPSLFQRELVVLPHELTTSFKLSSSRRLFLFSDLFNTPGFSRSKPTRASVLINRYSESRLDNKGYLQLTANIILPPSFSSFRHFPIHPFDSWYYPDDKDGMIRDACDGWRQNLKVIQPKSDKQILKFYQHRDLWLRLPWIYLSRLHIFQWTRENKTMSTLLPISQEKFD